MSVESRSVAVMVSFSSPRTSALSVESRSVAVMVSFSSPRTSAVSVESRSVAVMVSFSRLPSHFPLGWDATRVVLFTLSGGLLETGARF